MTVVGGAVAAAGVAVAVAVQRQQRPRCPILHREESRRSHRRQQGGGRQQKGPCRARAASSSSIVLLVLLLAFVVGAVEAAPASSSSSSSFSSAPGGGGFGRRPSCSSSSSLCAFQLPPRRDRRQQQQQRKQEGLMGGAGGGSAASRATSTLSSSSSSSRSALFAAHGIGDGAVLSPMAFSSGFSTLPDLKEAIREAVDMAVAGLPPPPNIDDITDAASPSSRDIAAGWVSVSSLYDGGTHSPATTVVPTVLESIFFTHRRRIDHLIGSSAAGCISSSSSSTVAAATIPPTTVPGQASKAAAAPAAPASSSSSSSCRTVEFDSVPAVTITLAILPDVVVDSFCVASSDVPDGDVRQYGAPPSEWRRAVGLSSRIRSPREESDVTGAGNNLAELSSSPPVFNVIMAPAFATDLDSLVTGMEHYYPGCQVVGGVASTVSSLSRAKLYQWSKAKNGVPTGMSSSSSPSFSFTCATDGCVGLACQGDVAVHPMMALGAKPVGGIYQVLKAAESTISVIVLDPVATDALEEGPSEGATQSDDADDDNTTESDDRENAADSSAPDDARQRMAQFYAKAQIPKPVLAEANFLMRTLSDDDQAFMRRQLLVGLEQGGGVGRTASELARLAAGYGHRFAIHPVASAGMKDGSVTLPLGSVNVQPGTRLRFFVREADFAKKEVEALWAGYAKRALIYQFARGRQPRDSADADVSTDNENGGDSSSAVGEFRPAACFIVPTLDRGSKFFLGKPGYEGSTVTRVLPGVTSVSGFFSNGVVGRIDGTVPPSTAPAPSRDNSLQRTGIQGSASGYFLWGPRSGRPVYSPARAAAEAAALKEARDAEDREAEILAAEDARRVLLSAQRSSSSSSLLLEDRAAPRSEDGELILKRREVHSGRALTVSTVEWSVAEKLAKPSSALEGFMWEKETEVDRFRERVPLANLVSQCRQSLTDPASPKPRDWVGPVVRAASASSAGFVIVPECKRMEPTTGSLRRRYDVSRLARECTVAGAPALSVNCDAVLFGGSLDDITKARHASSIAAVEGSGTSLDDDGVVVPPILASDLVLYPYQLYKLRLAGADAVTLVAGALARKDLLYLTKIASSLQLQVLVTVTSHVQILSLLDLPPGSFQGIIVSNRQLEDYSFDMTGEQALQLLRGAALRQLREKAGFDDLPVLVEGRVGILERPDPTDGAVSARRYLNELREAGAMGAIVGGGMATTPGRAVEDVIESLTSPIAPSPM